MFDFNNPLADPEELSIESDEGFQLVSPLGISVWTDPDSGMIRIAIALYSFCLRLYLSQAWRRLQYMDELGTAIAPAKCKPNPRNSTHRTEILGQIMT